MRGSSFAEGGTVTVKHSVGGMIIGVAARITPSSATTRMMLTMIPVMENAFLQC
jgi:hypothetical protein